MINLSPAEMRFIRVWTRLAIIIGIILPTIGFIVWFKSPEVRKIFGFYLLVLFIQLLTEKIVSSFRFSSLLVLVGTLYSAFRVWQLEKGKTTHSTQTNSRFISNVLWLLLLFWSSNLIVLLTLCLPSVL